MKFGKIGDYVVERLRGLLYKKKHRHLRAAESRTWTREYFESFGLTRLRGTIRYPEAG